jgi:KaiC/GvpD/RAD55 family RecA-like ATPase
MSGVRGHQDEGASTSATLAATLGENLLVTGDPMVGKRSFVFDVAAEAASNGRDVLVVTAAVGAERLPAALRESRNLTVVDCSPGSGESVGPVTTVSSPGDLTGVSMPVSRFLSSADSPVVLVDSVSTLLLYADEAPVFRFCSVLTAHVRRSDGLGLYTIDEGCHTEQTFRTFTQLFDGEVGLRATEASPAPDASPTEVRVRGLDAFDGQWRPGSE